MVDCSGRGSHTPAWLREWGYEPLVEERVQIGLAYTTAYFERAAGHLPVSAVVGAATAVMPRPSILPVQEPAGDGSPRWAAGVGGYAGDHVGFTREAMAERARQIHNPEITALAEHGKMIGELMRYTPYSHRRHYEKLRRLPSGNLVMGDALAGFITIYGHGMTMAACEAAGAARCIRKG